MEIIATQILVTIVFYGFLAILCLMIMASILVPKSTWFLSAMIDPCADDWIRVSEHIGSVIVLSLAAAVYILSLYPLAMIIIPLGFPYLTVLDAMNKR